MFRKNRASYVNGHVQDPIHLSLDQLVDLYHLMDDCHCHFDNRYNLMLAMIAQLVHQPLKLYEITKNIMKFIEYVLMNDFLTD